MIIYSKLSSSRLRHQYGIFGGESQTSFTRNATRAGSEEGRLFSQAICSVTSRCSGVETELEVAAEIKPTQTSEMVNFATLAKSAFGTFYLLFFAFFVTEKLFFRCQTTRKLAFSEEVALIQRNAA